MTLEGYLLFLSYDFTNSGLSFFDNSLITPFPSSHKHRSEDEYRGKQSEDEYSDKYSDYSPKHECKHTNLPIFYFNILFIVMILRILVFAILVFWFYFFFPDSYMPYFFPPPLFNHEYILHEKLQTVKKLFFQNTLCHFSPQFLYAIKSPFKDSIVRTVP